MFKTRDKDRNKKKVLGIQLLIYDSGLCTRFKFRETSSPCNTKVLWSEAIADDCNGSYPKPRRWPWSE